MAQAKLDVEENEELERAAIIAAANDAFRAEMAFGAADPNKGTYVVTRGVHAMGPEFVALAALSVAGDTKFTEDNDPYGDHTFGTVNVFGTKIYWKIDLYDTSYVWGSDDPTDPAKTRRVLTILLPAEY